jgi:hypothetical protein
LQNVEDKDKSFTSGSIYARGDDDVDDNEEPPPITPIELLNRSVDEPGDSYTIISDVGRGQGRGRGCGRGRGGRDRGVAMGRGRDRGAGAPVQEEDYTGVKVAFSPDTKLWPEYVCLSDRIHKDNFLTRFNRMPPPDAMKDGKSVAVVGKRGTLGHRNKYEVNFEYSFFKPMFVKRDVIKKILVPGDVAPLQSTLPTAEASILAHGGTCATRHTTRAAVA